MFAQILKSALWGVLASLIAVAIGFVLLLMYVHQAAQRQPEGIGVVVGGVLPLLVLAALAFTVTFLWNVIRRFGSRPN